MTDAVRHGRAHRRDAIESDQQRMRGVGEQAWRSAGIGASTMPTEQHRLRERDERTRGKVR